VVQLVEELRYKTEGRGFVSRRGRLGFSLTYSFRPLYAPRVDSASKNMSKRDISWWVNAAGA
jgi:hypothetical protein